MNLVLLFNMGPQEVLLIALLVLLLFGGKKIPELMKGLGKGIREFNNAKNSITSEINSEMKEIEKPKQKVEERSKHVVKERVELEKD